MGKLNLSNLRKTLYFLKRNGIVGTYYAVRERMAENPDDYRFTPVSEEQLSCQRAQAGELSELLISIVVPTYRTPQKFLLELILSVQAQSYPRWELILADASGDDSVKAVVDGICDDRLRYCRLERNGGISDNSNRGIEMASGDYIGLLDHDDILAPDALFEMVAEIEKKRAAGISVQLIYSDEDKCDSTAESFYEPHYKTDFNLDLLLSNNYICHFMMMKRELMQELRLRNEFDGAQDYDLMLRAVDRLYGQWERIAHVPKVLYHWRCHASSTAENPASKLYAYEAGRRALQAFADKRGFRATAQDTRHLGFYSLQYREPVFEIRREIGAVGYPVSKKGKITGGALTKDGKAIYEGLSVHYSGYMHRGALHQNAECLDIRKIVLRRSLQYLTRELFGVEYKTAPGTDCFDVKALPETLDKVQASVRLAEAIRDQGYLLLYLPQGELR